MNISTNKVVNNSWHMVNPEVAVNNPVKSNNYFINTMAKVFNKKTAKPATTDPVTALAKDSNSDILIREASDILGEKVASAETILPVVPEDGLVKITQGGPIVTKFYDGGGNLIGEHIVGDLGPSYPGEWYKVDANGNKTEVAKDIPEADKKEASNILGENVINGVTILPVVPAGDGIVKVTTGGPIVTKFYNDKGNLIGGHIVGDSGHNQPDVWYRISARGERIKIG